MNELNILKNEEVRINSVELVELINKFRKTEGNGKELKHKTFLEKIRKEVNTLQSLGFDVDKYFKSTSYINSQNKEQPCCEVTIKGLEWLRDNSKHDVRAYIYAIQQLDPNYKQEVINIAATGTRKELLINQVLLAWFNKEQIKTQYPVLNYRIDYFIPDVDLIIEYDEKYHKYYHEEDKKRMDAILNELFIKWKNAESKEDYEFFSEDDWFERETYTKPSQQFKVIRIKEFEEYKGLNELFEYLTGDVKCASILENL